jgi:hypothetical protein
MSDDKKPAPQEQLTMKQVVEQLIPAAIAAAVSATQKQQPAPQAAPRVGAPQRCTACNQQLTACSGKHVEMVVYPTRYPEHADFFPGAIINGAKYLSNDENHKVLVPENAAGTIKQIVQAFEQNEHEMQAGRKAQRHSGVVTPHGAAVTQANAAWR